MIELELDLNHPAFIRDPYPRLSELRQHTPIFYEPRLRKLFFTRYDDIAFLLRDKRLGRSITHILARDELGWPPPDSTFYRTEAQIAALSNGKERQFDAVRNMSAFDRFQNNIVMEREPPDHTRLRGLVGKAFTPQRVEGLRGKIETIVQQLIDALIAKRTRGEPVDLLADFAEPLPVTVIAELLGVPESERSHLRPWSAAIVKMYEVTRTVAQATAAVQAVNEFSDLLRALADQRRRQPQDDLITALVQAEEAGDKLSEDELIANCILLLNAGHEASVNGTTGGLLALFRHTDQLVLLKDAAKHGDAAIFKTAVDELLRFDTPLPLFMRWVLHDFEFSGVPLKRGTEVALLYAAGNRDERRFPHADQLDVQRADNPHLTFGLGTHYCLGAPLARLEMQIALATLLRRLPNLRLAIGENEVEYNDGFVIRGIKSLPVTW